MRMNVMQIAVAAGFSAIGSMASAQSLYIFQPVSGSQSTVVTSISDDGTNVSGWNPDRIQPWNGTAFWGTTAGARVDFGLRADLPPVSYASGISRDGEVVVGRTAEYRDDSTRAFRYRVSTNT
jgi:probable HAF family extracellular repeat protein